MFDAPRLRILVVSARGAPGRATVAELRARNDGGEGRQAGQVDKAL